MRGQRPAAPAPAVRSGPPAAPMSASGSDVASGQRSASGSGAAPEIKSEFHLTAASGAVVLTSQGNNAQRKRERNNDDSSRIRGWHDCSGLRSNSVLVAPDVLNVRVVMAFLNRVAQWIDDFVRHLP